MTNSPSIFRWVSLIYAAVSLLHSAAGLVTSVPTLHRVEDVTASTGGFSTVLWTVLDDCFGYQASEPGMVCLKSRALTALDRLLTKPTMVITDGVSLSSRAGRSLWTDPLAEEADSATLDTWKHSENKNTLLLDNMLADRIDEFVSTRMIVLDGSDVHEGRGKKKQQRTMRQALIMASMIAFAVLGPIAISSIAMLAGNALLMSKIALVTTGLMSIKKLLQPSKSNHGNPMSYAHDRHSDVDTQNMVYSGQIY